MFIASQNGHRAVLLQLLAQGCNPNVCRIDGASPLWIAAQMGHDHIVRILLKNGAYVDAVRCVSENLFIFNSNIYFTILKLFIFISFNRMVQRHFSKQRIKVFLQLSTNF